MVMDNNGLLEEFTEVIRSVGTEVSVRISKQVAEETTRVLLKETIFKELQKLEDEIGSLVVQLPTLEKEFRQQVSSSSKIREDFAHDVLALGLERKEWSRLKQDIKTQLDTQSQKNALMLTNMAEGNKRLWTEMLEMQKSLEQKLSLVVNSVGAIQIEQKKLLQKMERMEQMYDGK